jgi:general secretion pathway protein B
MSFILDALKKSEQERRRQHTPTIAELPYGRKTDRKPWWLWLVIALLLVNLVLVIVVLLRKDSVSPITTTSQPSAPAAAGSTSTQSNTQASREVRTLEDEAINPPEAQDSTSVLLSNAEVPATTPLVQAAPSSSNNLSMVTYAHNLRPGQTATLEGLGGAAALNLPELRLDLHVYSDNPAQRFVFINSKKYAEGQALNEGPLVQQITDAGVILNYHGQSFLLTRQ